MLSVILLKPFFGTDKRILTSEITHLTIVVIFNRLMYREDRVEQTSVMTFTIFKCDFSRLGCDETFLLKLADIFADTVPASVYGFTDCLETRITLIRFTVLAVHEVRVYKNRSIR